MGMLFHPDPEDQFLRIQYHPDYQKSVSLRTPLHDTVLLLSDPVIDFPRFADRTNLLNLLFLGLGASALCFVTWNSAVRLLGAVRTSVYIYLTPVITIVASVLILHEPFTWMTGIGTVLTLAGLVLSEGRVFRHKNQK